MKLATLKDSTRDGKLVVVSKDLTRCSEVGHIARTLQAALDDWAHVAPRLERVAQGLETGSQPTMRFHEHDAASPLPRAYSWTGGAGGFSGPRDPITIGAGADISFSARMAAIVDDVPVGATSGDGAVLLVLLANEVVSGGEAAGTAFSPVAVTPDELGGGLDDGAGFRLKLAQNGKSGGTVDVAANAASALSAAVRNRPLVAGSIVALGSSSGGGAPLSIGDVVRIEMNDKTGHSIFGAIEQTVQS